MGIVKKQTQRGLIFSYLGVALGFVTTSILMPRLLLPAQIGLLRVLSSFGDTFYAVFNLGFEGAAYKLFPRFRDDKNKHNGFLGVAFVFLMAGYFLAALFFFIFRDELVGTNNELPLDRYMILILPLVFFHLLYFHMDAYRSSIFKAASGVFYKEVLMRIGFMLSIILIALGWINYHLFVYLYIASLCLPGFALFADVFISGDFKFSFNFRFFSGPLRREFFDTALFTLLATSIGIFMHQIDILMLKYLVNLSAAGIYATWFSYGTMVLIPSRALKKIALPVISEAWNQGELGVIRDIYRKSCIILFIVGGYFFLGLWCNRHTILEIIPAEYGPYQYILFFIALNNLVDMGTGVNHEIIASSKYYRYNFIFVASLIVLLITANLFLIPAYGIVGAAIGTFAAMAVFNFVRFLFLYFKFGFQPFTWQFLKVIAVIAGVFALTELIPVFENKWLDLMCRGTVITLLFLPLVYALKASADFNEQLGRYLNKTLQVTGIRKNKVE